MVGYTGGMDVNADGGVNSDDEAWVLAVSADEGTSVFAEHSGLAYGWKRFFNNMLALNNAAALRSDFVRVPQSAENGNTAKVVTQTDELGPISTVYLRNVVQ